MVVDSDIHIHLGMNTSPVGIHWRRMQKLGQQASLQHINPHID